MWKNDRIHCLHSSFLQCSEISIHGCSLADLNHKLGRTLIQWFHCRWKSGVLLCDNCYRHWCHTISMLSFGCSLCCKCSDLRVQLQKARTHALCSIWKARSYHQLISKLWWRMLFTVLQSLLNFIWDQLRHKLCPQVHSRYIFSCVDSFIAIFSPDLCLQYSQYIRIV